MAIGDECCLGVSNEEDRRKTTESFLGYETGNSLFESDLEVDWTDPPFYAPYSSNTQKVKEAVEDGDLQNYCSTVTGANGSSQIHAESKKENQNNSTTESEPMCASGILCSGVKPCSMSNFVLTDSGCLATDPESASAGNVHALKVADGNINFDNNAAVDEELENVASIACAVKTDEEVTNVTVELIETDDKVPDNSEIQEKMEEDERSISPDEEGSKCSQSSDNGYASDSSNSDSSDNELSQAKSADEDSSSSDDDESSPGDSPSPPSADESSPFPCVEEVETRTGISFERTLSNSSQNDNCSSFSFSASSGSGMFGGASSGAGYANYGNVSEATSEHAQLRSRVMRLLDGGVRLIDDSERCLRRTVLLRTNLRRLLMEDKLEQSPTPRRRRHHIPQGCTEALSNGCLFPPRGSLVSSPNSGFPYDSISPFAVPIASSSCSTSSTYAPTCTVSSSNSCANRPLASDGDDEEPPMKRPRYATEENKENFGSSGSLFLASMHQYSSEASGFYGTSSGHYTSVCSNSNGGYYSTSSQSMYCMNHLTNHYSSSSTNYFTNSSSLGGGSSTQYLSSFNCSGSQTNNDRISSSSNCRNGSSVGSLGNTNNASYPPSCGQVDSFSSTVTSGNVTCGSSCPPHSYSNANNGGFYNASNVTSSSCSGVGLRSNLETIIEAIDQQILRGSYDTSTSRPLSNGASHTSPYGSFSSFPNGDGMFDGSSDSHSGSHIVSNTEGSSYHIFGNDRQGSSNNVFEDSSSSNYNMGPSTTSYTSGFSPYSSPYSNGAPQSPCGRSAQRPGNDFQSLVYSSLMASLES